MAHTEVFQADIDIKISGVDETVKLLNSLNKSAKDLTTSLNGISKLNISVRQITSPFDELSQRLDEIGFKVGRQGGIAENARQLQTQMAAIFRDIFGELDASQLDQAAKVIGTSADKILKEFQRLEKSGTTAFTSLPESAQDAANKIVFKSIIPDMIDEIINEFTKLPASFRTQAKILESQFRFFSAEFHDAVSDARFFDAKKMIDEIERVKNELRELRRVATFAEERGSAKGQADRFGLSDTFFEIESGIRRLKDKNTPEVVAFREDLIRLRAEFRQLGDEGGVSVNKFAKDLSTLADRFNDIQQNDAAAALQKSVDQLEGRTQAATKKQEAADQRRIDKVNELTGRIDSLRDAGTREVNSLAQAFRGFSLALTTPGARLQGIREAFIGTGSSTNLLVRGLDRVIGGTSTLVNAQDKLIASGAKIAKQSSDQIVSLKNQANQFRLLNQAELGNVGASEELNKQLTRLDSSFSQVIRTAERGGDIGRSLEAAREEGRRLTTQYQLLINSGLLPLNSESEKAFRTIVKESQDSIASLQALAVRYNASRRAAQEMGQEVRELGGASGKLVGSFNNVGQSLDKFAKTKPDLLSIFSLFRRGSSDIDQTERSVSRLQRTVQSVTSVTLNLGGVFKSVFLGSLLGSLSGNVLFRVLDSLEDALIRIPGAIVGLASRSEESVNRFTAVFGGIGDGTEQVADEVSAQLDQMAANMGRSALEFKEFASEFQDTFVPLGFARDEAAKMSLALTGLVTDVASFTNKLDADVARDFQSAIIGNTETVRKYGIIITQARLEQELINLGFEGSIQNASEEAKVLARLSLIQKGTTDAQGDAVKTADSWANQTKRLTANFQEFGIQLGQVVLPALAPFLQIINRIAEIAIPSIVSGFTAFGTTVQGFSSSLADTINNVLGGVIDFDSKISTAIGAVVALFSGDWTSAWGLFVITVSDAVENVASIVVGMVEQGFDWGFGFAAELGNGIVEAASQVVNAVLEIVNSIASFLAPGSPPAKGPLSTIDRWGQGLFETMFSDVQLDFFADLLDPIAKSLDDRFEGAAVPKFEAIKGSLAELVKELEDTGQINEDTFNKIAKEIDDPAATGQLRKQLEGRQKVAAANQKVADIEAQIAKAAEQGFVPAELQRQLAIAKEEAKVAEESVKQDEKRQGALERISKLEEELADKQEEGVSAISSAVSGATKGISKLKKTARDTFEARIAELDEQLAAGIITEEQYLSARIKAEKDWFDSVENTDKEATAVRIRELQARLDAVKAANKEEEALRKASLKEAAKGLQQGFLPQLDLPDLTGGLTDAIKGAGTRIGTVFTTDLRDSISTGVQGIRDALAARFASIVDTIKGLFSGGLVSIGPIVVGALQKGMKLAQDFIKSLPQEFLFPFSVLVGALGGARIVDIAFAGLNSVVQAIITLGSLLINIRPVIVGVGAAIRPLLGILFRWSVAGLIIVGLIQNWDQVMEDFASIVPIVIAVVGKFVSNLIEAGRVVLESDKSRQIINNLGAAFSLLGNVVNQVIGLIVKVVKKGLQFAVLGAVLGVIGGINRLIDAFGGIESVVNIVLDILLEGSDAFRGITAALNDAFGDLLRGDFQEFLDTVRTIPEILSESFSTGLATAALDKLKQGFIGLIPPGVIESFNQITEAVTTFINESRFISELFVLFETIIQDIDGLAVVLGTVAAIAVAPTVIAFTTAVVAAAAPIAALIAIIPALLENFDLIDGILAGLTRTITGFVELFSGIGDIIRAAVLAIVGVFTGDFDPAVQAFTEGVQGVFSGFGDIFAGLTEVFANAGTLIVVTITDTVQNALLIFGVAETEWGKPIFNAMESIKTFVKDSAAQALEIFEGLMSNISIIFGFLLEDPLNTLKTWVTSVIGFFKDLFTELVGSSIVPDIVNGIILWLVENLPAEVLSGIETFVSSLVDMFWNAHTGVINAASAIVEDFVSFIGTIPERIAGIASSVTGSITGLFSGGEGGGGLLAGIRGSLGSIFSSGGDDPEATGQAANALASVLPELQGSLTEFIAAFDAFIASLNEKWLLFVDNLLMQFQLFLTTMIENIVLFEENINLRIENFKISWQLFMTDILSKFRQTAEEMKAIFEDFIRTAIELIAELIESFEELIEVMEKVIDVARDLGESLIEAAEDAKTAFKDKLIPILDELVDKLETVEAAAKRAADAVGDIGGLGGGSPEGRAHGGPIRGGTAYQFHRDEIAVFPSDGFVLNRQDAAAALAGSIPSVVPRSALSDIPSVGGGDSPFMYIQEVNINNDMDMIEFETRVERTVQKKLRGF